jgi:hypothetical protein
VVFSAENICSKLVGAAVVRFLVACSCAIGGDLAGAGLVLDHGQLIARHRHAGKAQHLDRQRRPGFLDLLTLVVDHRANLAALLADDEDIADPQRAAPNQHGRHRAACPCRACASITRPSAARSGLALSSSSSAWSRIFSISVSRPGLLERGYFHILHLAAHVLDHDLMLKQTLAHALRVRGILSTLLIATIIGTPAALV